MKLKDIEQVNRLAVQLTGVKDFIRLTEHADPTDLRPLILRAMQRRPAAAVG